MRSILLSIFLYFIISGCTIIPEQEQFVSSTNKSSLTRSIGHCTDTIPRRTERSLLGLAAESISVLDWNIYKGRTTFFGDPVDHILYRGLEPVTNAVHLVTSSDHNPISVTFRLARTQDATAYKPL